MNFDNNLKKLLKTVIILTTVTIWSSQAPGETRNIRMRGNQEIQDDRPILLKITEDYTLPITKAITKPLTDSMTYVLERNLKKYKIENEFSKLYKSTVQCIRPENEVIKEKCESVYKSALAKFTKEKEEKENHRSQNSYMHIEKIRATK